MSARLKLTPRQTLLFMILGSTVFALYIYFSIGISQIVAVLDNLNFSSFLLFYGLSFVTMFLVMLSWSASWIILLRALSVNLSFKRTFFCYLAGDFVDRVIPSPGVAGEFARVLFVRREAPNAYGLIAAAGMTNRIVAYGVITVGLSIGILFLLITATLPVFASGLLMAVWFGSLILFVLLSFVSLKDNAAKTLVSGLIRLLKILRVRINIEKSSERVLNFLSPFHDGFKFFGANPQYLIGPIIFNILSFTLNMAVYVLVFYALGLTYLPIDFFIVVYFLAGAVQDGLAAFSVGGLEILLTSIFILYGIPPATSGVAAVILRGVTFYFPLISGYISLQIIGAKNMLNPKNIAQIKN